jgi:hypothetical protein
MSVVDVLLDLFRSEEEQAAFADDPSAYLESHGLEGITADDVLAAMPDVCAQLPPEQADVLRTSYGIAADAPTSGGSSGGSSGGGSSQVDIDPQAGDVPPPPVPDPADSPLEQVVQQINHYTTVVNISDQTFVDNDITTIDDRDTTVDNSVNQNIEAFGDVNQTFDNDIVSGDGAVAAGDASQVNTGDGAVQAGGDITDATIATGDVQGSVTGDVTDSVVGDGNQVVDDSTVGAVTFGEGDATNVAAENAVLGDGTIVDGGEGDIAFNQGDGDLTQIEGSTLSESVVGGGTVQSNDADISATDGSSVAFGDGSDADSGDVDIDGNYGTVQVAGDGATQAATTDNSISDSGNTTVDYSDNSVDNSLDYSDNSVDNSVDTAVDYSDNSVDYSDNSVDTSVDTSDNSINTYTDQSDDDVADIDVALG